MLQFRYVAFTSVFSFALLFSVLSSSAMTMQAVYQGTVSDGKDVNGGTFGSPEQVLTGEAFSLTFLYDTNAPGAFRYTDGTVDYIYQQTDFGIVHDPILSAVLTINGQSYNFDSDKVGQAYTQSDGPGGYGETYHHAFDTGSDGVTYSESYVFAHLYTNILGQLFTASLDTPITLSLAEGIFGDSYFQTFSCSSALGPCDLGYNINNAYGYLTAETVTISKVSEVPLPTALPLLASGFGLFGFMSWRKKSSARKARDHSNLNGCSLE